MAHNTKQTPIRTGYSKLWMCLDSIHFISCFIDHLGSNLCEHVVNGQEQFNVCNQSLICLS